MTLVKDPFAGAVDAETDDEFRALTRQPVARVPVVGSAATARLHGFDLDDRPLLAALPNLHGEIVPARTTVALRRDQIGESVLVVFDRGSARDPIVVGVVQRPRREQEVSVAPGEPLRITADNHDVVVVKAEREIRLQCGDASITLTRAGKVIITGTYVVSRSSGYNKIKGAAVDIN